MSRPDAATRRDLERMLEVLSAAGTDGITREGLAPLFGGDRRARRILSILRASGLAAVVSRPNERGEHTYRIAVNREEYASYRRSLVARIVALARAIKGLDVAYKWQDDSVSPLLERAIELGKESE